MWNITPPCRCTWSTGSAGGRPTPRSCLAAAVGPAVRTWAYKSQFRPLAGGHTSKTNHILAGKSGLFNSADRSLPQDPARGFAASAFDDTPVDQLVDEVGETLGGESGDTPVSGGHTGDQADVLTHRPTDRLRAPPAPFGSSGASNPPRSDPLSVVRAGKPSTEIGRQRRAEPSVVRSQSARGLSAQVAVQLLSGLEIGQAVKRLAGTSRGSAGE